MTVAEFDREDLFVAQRCNAPSVRTRDKWTANAVRSVTLSDDR